MLCSVKVFSTTHDSDYQENRKIGWVREDSHVIFGQNFPTERGSVRWCVVVMQQPVLLSPKFGAKSPHIFAQSP
jgi:hypothetical protein